MNEMTGHHRTNSRRIASITTPPRNTTTVPPASHLLVQQGGESKEEEHRYEPISSDSEEEEPLEPQNLTLPPATPPVPTRADGSRRFAPIGLTERTYAQRAQARETGGAILESARSGRVRKQPVRLTAAVASKNYYSVLSDDTGDTTTDTDRPRAEACTARTYIGGDSSSVQCK